MDGSSGLALLNSVNTVTLDDTVKDVFVKLKREGICSMVEMSVIPPELSQSDANNDSSDLLLLTGGVYAITTNSYLRSVEPTSKLNELYETDGFFPINPSVFDDYIRVSPKKSFGERIAGALSYLRRFGKNE